jgi:hypothetical protein
MKRTSKTESERWRGKGKGKGFVDNKRKVEGTTREGKLIGKSFSRIFGCFFFLLL